MNILLFLGLASTFAGYALTALYLKMYPSENISFSTFALWAILDLISAITIYFEGGIWQLPFLFFLGSGGIAVMLYWMGKIKLNLLDALIFFLIIVCLVIWCRLGRIDGTIAATVAILIASIPQGYENYKLPDKKLAFVVSFFLWGNILIFFSSDATNYEAFIHDRLCPLANGIMAFVMICILLRKPKPKIA